LVCYGFQGNGSDGNMMAKTFDHMPDYREGHTPRYWPHNPETVALVGMGPSIKDLMSERLTQEAAPDFADEIWTINMTSMFLHHDLTIWMDDLYDQESFKPGLMAELRRMGKPVITAKSYPDIVPTSYDFPLDEAVRMSMHYFGKPYLNSGVAQGVAYAILKKVKTLKLYGCDFTYPDRGYAESGRACAEAWLTIANTMGMELKVAPSTSLFDACDDKIVYGYKGPLKIHLGGDNYYEYVTPTEAQKRQEPDYVPEDSSGRPVTEDTSNAELSRTVPGTQSNGADADGGDGLPGRVEGAIIAPAAAGGPGDGLRHPDQSGSDQEPDIAAYGGGGAAGPVSPAGDGSGGTPKSAAKPRRAPKNKSNAAGRAGANSAAGPG
jgi:hypothetical protein